MITAAAMALASVLAFFVTACRIVPLRRLLGWGMALDVSFSLLIFAAFAGTLTGLLIATLGGLAMSVTVSTLRALLGFERPHLIRYAHVHFAIIWTPHKPAWRA